MSEYSEVMVDIETLGVGTESVVLSIGAVKFNLEDQDTPDGIDASRRFHMILNVDDQIRRGREISFSTIQWWIKQDAAAVQVLLADQQSVKKVLSEFQKFCEGTERLWGNGNMFDNAILRSLFKTYTRSFPYHFRKDMDMRTLKVLADGSHSDNEFVGVKHDAVDDAKNQAVLCQIWHKKLHP